ncbi:MAG: hypothetical protein A3F93_04535 [Candidatus Magasanikbacteria bacterium RIFCSPLOWO2_12_FULL_34_7]|nr:MAG: hypothetical protein A3F93_04535 [Candidatus Magasanikbacteria bacterium RIFCSPLOWO2_12_FULL_34_7]
MSDDNIKKPNIDLPTEVGNSPIDVEVRPIEGKLLGLKAEMESVIAEHGKDIREKKIDLDNLLKEVSDLLEEIKGFEDPDIDNAKKRLGDLQNRLKVIEDKYNTVIDEYGDLLLDDEEPKAVSDTNEDKKLSVTLGDNSKNKAILESLRGKLPDQNILVKGSEQNVVDKTDKVEIPVEPESALEIKTSTRAFPEQPDQFEKYIDNVWNETGNAREATDIILNEFVNNTSADFIVKYGFEKIKTVERKLLGLAMGASRLSLEELKKQVKEILNEEIFNKAEPVVAQSVLDEATDRTELPVDAESVVVNGEINEDTQRTAIPNVDVLSVEEIAPEVDAVPEFVEPEEPPRRVYPTSRVDDKDSDEVPMAVVEEQVDTNKYPINPFEQTQPTPSLGVETSKNKTSENEISDGKPVVLEDNIDTEKTFVEPQSHRIISADVIDEYKRLNQLKENLEEKRKAYIQAKKLYETKDDAFTRVGRIFSRKKIADIETNFARAEVEYREARAEYVGASIEKALDEQISVVEAEVEDITKDTKLEKGWAKAMAFYKKLGELNLANLVSKTKFGKREIEKMSWFGKTVTRMLSVRTGAFAASTLAGFAGIALAGAFRFVGSSGLSYDFMDNLSKARKESKGLLKPMSKEEIEKLSDEDISKRMRTIEGVVVMDGVKLQTSKYFENYKLLQTEYKKRHAQEYVVDETIEKKDSNAFLDSSMKKADDELEKELKDLRSGRTKRKVVAGAIGVVAVSGLVGKLIRKGGSGVMSLYEHYFGNAPDESVAGVGRLAIPEDNIKIPDTTPDTAPIVNDTTPATTSVESVVEKMTPEKFKEEHYDSLVHKGEGVTHVLQRDLHANPEHLQAYQHIKGVDKIVQAHDGDYTKITTKELNRAAWLIENDKTNGFGQEVLIKGPNDNVAVVFDNKSNRYVMGTMDDSDITKRIYSKLDVTVTTDPVTIENVDGTAIETEFAKVPATLQGSEIKHYYPTDNGFGVEMYDGNKLEGYRWEAMSPRGGEVGNNEALMSGDAQLSAGPHAEYVSGPAIDAMSGDRSNFDIVGHTETIQKTINVPFTGELPKGSAFVSTEAMINAVENKPSGVTEAVDVNKVVADISLTDNKVDAISGADHFVKPENNLAVEKPIADDVDKLKVESEENVSYPSEEVVPVQNTQVEAEDAETSPETEKIESNTEVSVVDPEIQNKYREVYDQEFNKYLNYLKNRVNYHSIEGHDVKDSASFGSLIVQDLGSSSTLDSSNQELIDLLKTDAKASSEQIAEAVRMNMLNHITDDYKDEAELLFNTEQANENEIDVVKGGSNVMKISSNGKDYIIFDKEYTFLQGDNGVVVAVDSNGKEHLIDVDLSETPPKITVKD